MGEIRRQMPQVVPCEPPAVGEDRGQSAQLAKRHPGARKSPPGFRKKPSASVDHPYTQSADARGGLDKSETEGGKVPGQNCIRIEKQDILSAGLLKREVVGPAETDVLVI